MFTRAQFYAEDGAVWYAQAYNNGWFHSLLVPQSGYLNLLPRLGAALALLVPLKLAPLLMNAIGLLFQCLPVTVLLHARCRGWGPLPFRILLAILYIAQPNANEIHVVITNAQWHLALATVLLGFASPPATRLGRSFDVLIFLLAGLSGPYCILLVPFVLAFWWFRRHTWTLIAASVMSIGVVAQVITIINSTVRQRASLGASAHLLIRIVGSDIVTALMMGGKPIAARVAYPILVVAAALGVSIYIFCVLHASAEIRLFMLYSVALLAVSLRSPLVPGEHSLWDILVWQTSGRYWFFPSLGLLWGIAWCTLFGKYRVERMLGLCAACLIPVGVVWGWEYPSLGRGTFAADVERINQAAPGTRFVVPILPVGTSMVLFKRGK